MGVFIFFVVTGHALLWPNWSGQYFKSIEWFVAYMKNMKLIYSVNINISWLRLQFTISSKIIQQTMIER